MEIEKSCQFGYWWNMKWYERAKERMQTLGLKQSELAKRIGESNANISRYFAGIRGQDSLELATKMAEALGMTLDHLIFGVEAQHESAHADSETEHKIPDSTIALLQMTRTVIESDTKFGQALIANIEAFYLAVTGKKSVHQDPPMVANEDSG